VSDPGRIIYYYPPDTDGIRYFMLIHHPPSRTYRLRASDATGNEREAAAGREAMLEILEGELGTGSLSVPAAAAAKALRGARRARPN
jgi:hypothetical protein